MFSGYKDAPPYYNNQSLFENRNQAPFAPGDTSKQTSAPPWDYPQQSFNTVPCYTGDQNLNSRHIPAIHNQVVSQFENNNVLAHFKNITSTGNNHQSVVRPRAVINCQSNCNACYNHSVPRVPSHWNAPPSDGVHYVSGNTTAPLPSEEIPRFAPNLPSFTQHEDASHHFTSGFANQLTKLSRFSKDSSTPSAPKKDVLSPTGDCSVLRHNPLSRVEPSPSDSAVAKKDSCITCRGGVCNRTKCKFYQHHAVKLPSIESLPIQQYGMSRENVVRYTGHINGSSSSNQWPPVGTHQPPGMWLQNGRPPGFWIPPTENLHNMGNAGMSNFWGDSCEITNQLPPPPSYHDFASEKAIGPIRNQSQKEQEGEKVNQYQDGPPRYSEMLIRRKISDEMHYQSQEPSLAECGISQDPQYRHQGDTQTNKDSSGDSSSALESSRSHVNTNSINSALSNFTTSDLGNQTSNIPTYHEMKPPQSSNFSPVLGIAQPPSRFNSEGNYPQSKISRSNNYSRYFQESSLDDGYNHCSDIIGTNFATQPPNSGMTNRHLPLQSVPPKDFLNRSIKCPPDSIIRYGGENSVLGSSHLQPCAQSDPYHGVNTMQVVENNPSCNMSGSAYITSPPSRQESGYQNMLNTGTDSSMFYGRQSLHSSLYSNDNYNNIHTKVGVISRPSRESYQLTPPPMYLHHDKSQLHPLLEDPSVSRPIKKRKPRTRMRPDQEQWPQERNDQQMPTPALDVRQFLATWDEETDDLSPTGQKLPDVVLSNSSAENSLLVLDCRTINSNGVATLSAVDRNTLPDGSVSENLVHMYQQQISPAAASNVNKDAEKSSRHNVGDTTPKPIGECPTLVPVESDNIDAVDKQCDLEGNKTKQALSNNSNVPEVKYTSNQNVIEKTASNSPEDLTVLQSCFSSQEDASDTPDKPDMPVLEELTDNIRLGASPCLEEKSEDKIDIEEAAVESCIRLNDSKNVENRPNSVTTEPSILAVKGIVVHSLKALCKAVIEKSNLINSSKDVLVREKMNPSENCSKESGVKHNTVEKIPLNTGDSPDICTKDSCDPVKDLSISGEIYIDPVSIISTYKQCKTDDSVTANSACENLVTNKLLEKIPEKSSEGNEKPRLDLVGCLHNKEAFSETDQKLDAESMNSILELSNSPSIKECVDELIQSIDIISKNKSSDIENNVQKDPLDISEKLCVIDGDDEPEHDKNVQLCLNDIEDIGQDLDMSVTSSIPSTPNSVQHNDQESDEDEIIHLNLHVNDSASDFVLSSHSVISKQPPLSPIAVLLKESVDIILDTHSKELTDVRKSPPPDDIFAHLEREALIYSGESLNESINLPDNNFTEPSSEPKTPSIGENTSQVAFPYLGESTNDFDRKGKLQKEENQIAGESGRCVEDQSEGNEFGEKIAENNTVPGTTEVINSEVLQSPNIVNDSDEVISERKLRHSKSNNNFSSSELEHPVKFVNNSANEDPQNNIPVSDEQCNITKIAGNNVFDETPLREETSHTLLEYLQLKYSGINRTVGEIPIESNPIEQPLPSEKDCTEVDQITEIKGRITNVQKRHSRDISHCEAASDPVNLSVENFDIGDSVELNKLQIKCKRSSDEKFTSDINNQGTKTELLNLKKKPHIGDASEFVNSDIVGHRNSDLEPVELEAESIEIEECEPLDLTNVSKRLSGNDLPHAINSCSGSSRSLSTQEGKSPCSEKFYNISHEVSESENCKNENKLATSEPLNAVNQSPECSSFREKENEVSVETCLENVIPTRVESNQKPTNVCEMTDPFTDNQNSAKTPNENVSNVNKVADHENISRSVRSVSEVSKNFPGSDILEDAFDVPNFAPQLEDKIVHKHLESQIDHIDPFKMQGNTSIISENCFNERSFSSQNLTVSSEDCCGVPKHVPLKEKDSIEDLPTVFEESKIGSEHNKSVETLDNNSPSANQAEIESRPSMPHLPEAKITSPSNNSENDDLTDRSEEDFNKVTDSQLKILGEPSVVKTNDNNLLESEISVTEKPAKDISSRVNKASPFVDTGTDSSDGESSTGSHSFKSISTSDEEVSSTGHTDAENKDFNPLPVTAASHAETPHIENKCLELDGKNQGSNDLLDIPKLNTIGREHKNVQSEDKNKENNEILKVPQLNTVDKEPKCAESDISDQGKINILNIPHSNTVYIKHKSIESEVKDQVNNGILGPLRSDTVDIEQKCIEPENKNQGNNYVLEVPQSDSVDTGKYAGSEDKNQGSNDILNVPWYSDTEHRYNVLEDKNQGNNEVLHVPQLNTVIQTTATTLLSNPITKSPLCNSMDDSSSENPCTHIAKKKSPSGEIKTSIPDISKETTFKDEGKNLVKSPLISLSASAVKEYYGIRSPFSDTTVLDYEMEDPSDTCESPAYESVFEPEEDASCSDDDSPSEEIVSEKHNNGMHISSLDSITLLHSKVENVQSEENEFQDLSVDSESVVKEDETVKAVSETSRIIESSSISSSVVAPIQNVNNSIVEETSNVPDTVFSSEKKNSNVLDINETPKETSADATLSESFDKIPVTKCLVSESLSLKDKTDTGTTKNIESCESPPNVENSDGHPDSIEAASWFMELQTSVLSAKENNSSLQNNDGIQPNVISSDICVTKGSRKEKGQEEEEEKEEKEKIGTNHSETQENCSKNQIVQNDSTSDLGLLTKSDTGTKEEIGKERTSVRNIETTLSQRKNTSIEVHKDETNLSNETAESIHASDQNFLKDEDTIELPDIHDVSDSDVGNNESERPFSLVTSHQHDLNSNFLKHNGLKEDVNQLEKSNQVISSCEFECAVNSASITKANAVDLHKHSGNENGLNFSNLFSKPKDLQVEMNSRKHDSKKSLLGSLLPLDKTCPQQKNCFPVSSFGKNLAKLPKSVLEIERKNIASLPLEENTSAEAAVRSKDENNYFKQNTSMVKPNIVSSCTEYLTEGKNIGASHTHNSEQKANKFNAMENVTVETDDMPELEVIRSEISPNSSDSVEMPHLDIITNTQTLMVGENDHTALVFENKTSSLQPIEHSKDTHNIVRKMEIEECNNISHDCKEITNVKDKKFVPGSVSSKERWLVTKDNSITTGTQSPSEVPEKSVESVVEMNFSAPRTLNDENKESKNKSTTVLSLSEVESHPTEQPEVEDSCSKREKIIQETFVTTQPALKSTSSANISDVEKSCVVEKPTMKVCLITEPGTNKISSLEKHEIKSNSSAKIPSCESSRSTDKTEANSADTKELDLCTKSADNVEVKEPEQAKMKDLSPTREFSIQGKQKEPCGFEKLCSSEQLEVNKSSFELTVEDSPPPILEPEVESVFMGVEKKNSPPSLEPEVEVSLPGMMDVSISSVTQEEVDDCPPALEPELNISPSNPEGMEQSQINSDRIPPEVRDKNLLHSQNELSAESPQSEECSNVEDGMQELPVSPNTLQVLSSYLGADTSTVQVVEVSADEIPDDWGAVQLVTCVPETEDKAEEIQDAVNTSEVGISQIEFSETANSPGEAPAQTSEINETLDVIPADSVSNWPYLEEEVAEYQVTDTDAVAPCVPNSVIPPIHSPSEDSCLSSNSKSSNSCESSPIDTAESESDSAIKGLKCRLSWKKIFALTKASQKKKQTSDKIHKDKSLTENSTDSKEQSTGQLKKLNGVIRDKPVKCGLKKKQLELGPAKIELRLTPTPPPQGTGMVNKWEVVNITKSERHSKLSPRSNSTDGADSTVPIVVVKRIILKRRSSSESEVEQPAKRYRRSSESDIERVVEKKRRLSTDTEITLQTNNISENVDKNVVLTAGAVRLDEVNSGSESQDSSDESQSSSSESDDESSSESSTESSSSSMSRSKSSSTSGSRSSSASSCSSRGRKSPEPDLCSRTAVNSDDSTISYHDPLLEVRECDKNLLDCGCIEHCNCNSMTDKTVTSLNTEKLLPRVIIKRTPVLDNTSINGYEKRFCNCADQCRCNNLTNLPVPSSKGRQLPKVIIKRTAEVVNTDAKDVVKQLDCGCTEHCRCNSSSLSTGKEKKLPKVIIKRSTLHVNTLECGCVDICSCKSLDKMESISNGSTSRPLPKVVIKRTTGVMNIDEDNVKRFDCGCSEHCKCGNNLDENMLTSSEERHLPKVIIKRTFGMGNSNKYKSFLRSPTSSSEMNNEWLPVVRIERSTSLDELARKITNNNGLHYGLKISLKSSTCKPHVSVVPLSPNRNKRSRGHSESEANKKRKNQSYSRKAQSYYSRSYVRHSGWRSKRGSRKSCTNSTITVSTKPDDTPPTSSDTNQPIKLTFSNYFKKVQDASSNSDQNVQLATSHNMEAHNSNTRDGIKVGNHGNGVYRVVDKRNESKENATKITFQRHSKKNDFSSRKEQKVIHIKIKNLKKTNTLNEKKNEFHHPETMEEITEDIIKPSNLSHQQNETEEANESGNAEENVEEEMRKDKILHSNENEEQILEKRTAEDTMRHKNVNGQQKAEKEVMEDTISHISDRQQNIEEEAIKDITKHKNEKWKTNTEKETIDNIYEHENVQDTSEREVEEDNDSVEKEVRKDKGDAEKEARKGTNSAEKVLREGIDHKNEKDKQNEKIEDIIQRSCENSQHNVEKQQSESNIASQNEEDNQSSGVKAVENNNEYKNAITENSNRDNNVNEQESLGQDMIENDKTSVQEVINEEPEPDDQMEIQEHCSEKKHLAVTPKSVVDNDKLNTISEVSSQNKADSALRNEQALHSENNHSMETQDITIVNRKRPIDDIYIDDKALPLFQPDRILTVSSAKKKRSAEKTVSPVDSKLLDKQCETTPETVLSRDRSPYTEVSASIDSGDSPAFSSDSFESDNSSFDEEYSEPDKPASPVASSKSAVVSRPDPRLEGVCQACGHIYCDQDERASHIRRHPYHCQRCHLAFVSEADFVTHLSEQHPRTRERHHCLLCERSFPTGEHHKRHVAGHTHRHLELTQRRTIHTLYEIFTGQNCPVLQPLSETELAGLNWFPVEPGTIHFYHQATPLQRAVQDLRKRGASTVAPAPLDLRRNSRSAEDYPSESS